MAVSLECLTPNCGKQGFKVKSGLCRDCYYEAEKLVNEGKTTWTELVNLGLVTRPDSPFQEAFRVATGTRNGDSSSVNDR